MQTSRINGAEIEYEVIGDGQPVLFLHGVLLGDSFQPMLAEPGIADSHRCITWHRRGYAGSRPGPSSDSVEEAAADARALLEYLGIGRAHVVGHSYGGCVALQLALDAPERVYSLALVEAALLAGRVSKPIVMPSAKRQAFDPGNAERSSTVHRRALASYRPVLDEVAGHVRQAVVGEHGVRASCQAGRWSFDEAAARRLACRRSLSSAVTCHRSSLRRCAPMAAGDTAERRRGRATRHDPPAADADPALVAGAISRFWTAHLSRARDGSATPGMQRVDFRIGASRLHRCTRSVRARYRAFRSVPEGTYLCAYQRSWAHPRSSQDCAG